VSDPAQPSRSFFSRLVCRRSVPVPTWRGWLALLLAAAVLCGATMRWACPFLTVNDSVPGGVLVVEGWVAPPEAKKAFEEFQRGGYTSLYVTGEPIEKGSPLDSYESYATLTADVLQRFGADPAKVHAVPAPFVTKDRTYSTAVALKKALLASGVPMAKVNVVSGGTHSRRTRLLYEKAFGPGTRVGMIALPEREFDPAHWWASSAGVRTVVGELVAYAYARFLFIPPAE
jgi:hypothetical protein